MPLSRPELIFAMAGPLGTRLVNLSDQLERELQEFGYSVVRIRLSSLLRRFPDWKELDGSGADARVRHHQGVANVVRSRTEDGAVLARAAIAEIRRSRMEQSGGPDKPLPNYAF